jgi:hypothetical protein
MYFDHVIASVPRPNGGSPRLPYSPKCGEEEFCELRLEGGSWKFATEVPNITQMGDAALHGRGQHAREGKGWAHLFYDWVGKQEH